MTQNKANQGAGVFFVLLIGVTVLVLAMIYPYLGVIFFSLVMVFVLKPLYDWLLARLNNRPALAVAVTLLITTIIPVAVVGLAGSLLLDQLSGLAGGAPGGGGEDIAGLMSKLLDSLGGAVFAQDQATNSDNLDLLVKLASALVGVAASLGFSMLNLLLNLIIFITIVAPLLIHSDLAMEWVHQVSPFPYAADQLFITRIQRMIVAMFLSIFVIALAQCLVMGVFYWLAGVRPIIVWMFLSFLASTLPFGNSIIALPLGVYLLATGNVSGGWILILGYLLIISNMDTVMRPKLIPKGTSLVYVLALLASLGGLSLFGYLGVIYGPVIMVTFVTAVEVYLKYYTPPKDALV